MHDKCTAEAAQWLPLSFTQSIHEIEVDWNRQRHWGCLRWGRNELTVKSWSSPCGTSPGRRFWPARRCTLSPCKSAPGWQSQPGYRRRCSSSDGRSSSSPAACPRTLEEHFKSQLVHPQQTELQTSVWFTLSCVPTKRLAQVLCD